MEDGNARKGRISETDSVRKALHMVKSFLRPGMTHREARLIIKTLVEIEEPMVTSVGTLMENTERILTKIKEDPTDRGGTDPVYKDRITDYIGA